MINNHDIVERRKQTNSEGEYKPAATQHRITNTTLSMQFSQDDTTGK